MKPPDRPKKNDNMNKLLISLFFAWGLTLQAQNSYTLSLQHQAESIQRGHLNLGGTNPQGDSIGVNSHYIEKNGSPFYPIIGEFHYSRFPKAYWEEEIQKMKAGGLNIIATYVFWNLHERQPGNFDWTNDLDLRHFLELIHKNELQAIVRVGPFCHGEMRNGGIPDWLYGQPFEIRSNDPGYLDYVDRLYGQIGRQLEDLLYQDGGPVIGIQLENEYQHSAAPWEWGYPGGKTERTVANRDAAQVHNQITVSDGQNPWFEYGKLHMNNLKQLAQKNGLNVPLYTATGWGNATIVEQGSLPVTAAYAYPFWANPYPSPFYLFKDIKHQPDYSPVSYDTRLYPSLSAEIGPGIQIKYSRRPFVPYESVLPLMVRTVGSGSNGIGYYMYHGGSTPQFDGKFYNEEANGIPRVNYDFQAPLGQYGQAREHYHDLRLLHSFLDSYGSELAPMTTLLPPEAATLKPENTETLRYAVRTKDNAGFLFIINFQDHAEVQSIDDVSIELEGDGESFRFPRQGSLNIPKATSAIFPFNLPLGGATLKTATVQPFTALKGTKGSYHVFTMIDGIAAELNFSSETKITGSSNADLTKHPGSLTVKPTKDGPFSFMANGENILVLPMKMARNAVKVGEQLYFSEALLLDNQEGLQLISKTTHNLIHVFPQGPNHFGASHAQIKTERPIAKNFSSFSVHFETFTPEYEWEQVSTQKYLLRLNTDFHHINDLMVSIDYVGDRGLAFINGSLLTDHFYHGRQWEISLKAVAPELEENSILFFFHPMYDDAPYLKDFKPLPEFKNGKVLEVKGLQIVPEYKTLLKL